MNKPLIAITGASSGIGDAIATQFSAAGHPLLLIARRLERLTALNLPHCVTAKVDVTDKEALAKAVQKAETRYGAVDCMVNNAGVMLLGDIEDQNATEWQKMMDTNVVGVLNGMQAVLKGMKERRHGTIINISSIAGRKTFAHHAAYCGTKFAVHAISEQVREDVADYNIRVITIAPGAVETELLSHTSSQPIKDGYKSWKESIGGALSADNVAQSVLFAYQQPQKVCLREIVIAATGQQK